MKAYHNIPDEMKSYVQWVVWRYEWPAGPNDKPTKVPYNPRNGQHASVKNPATWVTFDEAVSADNSNIGYDGIGFVFTPNDPYCGFDLDEADSEDGSIFDRQKRVFEYLNSYSELSPSGNGLHVIVRASVPHGRKRSAIECYSNERYFTMTGNVYRNAPIADRQLETQAIWSEMGTGAQPVHFAGDIIQREDDEAIYKKAAAAKNGDVFLKLWNGDWSGYAPNNSGTASSEADLALVDIIAYYTQNRGQIGRMFLASALGKREKYIKRPALLGYMINKSFDRMLPPVDLSAVIDKVNAAVAGPLDDASVSLSAPLSPPVAAPMLAPGDLTSADETPAFLDGYDLTKWKHAPPGLVGAMARFIYDAAPRPVYEIAIAGAIGLMAGICGRGYNATGTGLNHYIMLLANTGSGKEAIASGVDKIIDSVAKSFPSARGIIGPSHMASGQGLLKYLSEAECLSFLSITGEIGLRLQQISSPYANASDVMLRSVLLDLYGKSGAGKSVKPSIYSDKKNNTKEIFAPAFTLLGESVPSEFYKAFDETAVLGGLLPRFTIIEYDGPRVPLNEFHTAAVVPTWLTGSLSELIAANFKRMQSGEVIGCEPDAEADALLKQINEYADAKLNASNSNVLKELWNRAHLKTFKLAALLAIGVSPWVPTITLPMVEWASSLVFTDIIRLTSKFEKGQIGANNEVSEQETAIRSVIRQYFEKSLYELKGYQVKPKLHQFKVISRTYLTLRLPRMAAFRLDKRGAAQAVAAQIKTLEDNGILRRLPPKQLKDDFEFEGQAFVCDDFLWLKG